MRILTVLWNLPLVHSWNRTSVVLVPPQKILFIIQDVLFANNEDESELNPLVSPVLGWQPFIYSFCPMCRKLFDVYCEEYEYKQVTIYMVRVHKNIKMGAVGVPDRKI